MFSKTNEQSPLMSPVAVFIRTLLKSSAIFIGTAAIFLHPSLECPSTAQREVGTAVGAQSDTERAVDGLIGLLKDPDAGVRRTAAHALAQMNRRRAAPALAAALHGAAPPPPPPPPPPRRTPAPPRPHPPPR